MAPPTGGKGFDPPVYHVAPDGKSAWLDTSSGRVDVAPGTLAEKVRAGAKTIEVKDLAPEKKGVRRTIRFGERGKVAKEDRDEPVSPEMRAAVLARDGHRCVVCGRMKDIEVHHLEPLADGGLSEMDCCLSLCDPCHGSLHEQELLLRIEDDGKVTVLDADGRDLGREESAAKVLAEAGEDTPLETIEVKDLVGKEPGTEGSGDASTESMESGAPEATRPGGAPIATEDAFSSVILLDELPAELTASQWRALEGRLEWSPTHNAFLLRPEGEESDVSVETGSGSHRKATAERAETALQASPTRPRSFEEHVHHAAERAGIDKHGLSREDRAVVLLLLERDAPMGLEAIASRLGLDLQTLREVHEPWLERAGLVERTVRGRVATERARAWYGRLVVKGGGLAANQGPAGPHGGLWSIPVLRPPFKFG